MPVALVICLVYWFKYWSLSETSSQTCPETMFQQLSGYFLTQSSWHKINPHPLHVWEIKHPTEKVARKLSFSQPWHQIKGGKNSLLRIWATSLPSGRLKPEFPWPSAGQKIWSGELPLELGWVAAPCNGRSKWRFILLVNPGHRRM